MSNTVKIPFKCKRCTTTWERTMTELDQLDVAIYKGLEPKSVTYRDNCPACGALAVTEATEPGGRHA